MVSEFGKCCKCGEEIGPYDRNNEDWLCKQCYDKTRPRGGFRYNPRLNEEPIQTSGEREQNDKWQDEIIDRIDKENSNHKDTKNTKE
ncbi:MAG: hypothetical protein V1871_04915 [Planctomycetota bacterium]